jgi:hypothetical protein
LCRIGDEFDGSNEEDEDGISIIVDDDDADGIETCAPA